MTNEQLTPRNPPTSPITVGDHAPDFTLPDQNKADWTLSTALKRGDVVLCFYPLSFTGVCGKEMKCVTDEMARWKAKGASVVGISSDSYAVQKAWADSMGFKQPLLSDIHRHVCKAYGFFWPAMNVPSRGTVVIGKDADGQGKVKWVEAREVLKAMDFEKVIAAV